MQTSDIGARENLAAAMAVPRGVTALVGGGGKTTLMLRLARALSACGRVIVCTTTHIWKPEDMPCLLSPTPEEIRAALASAPCLCAGTPCADGKLRGCGVPMPQLRTLADHVLVEADGAKGRPLKAPREGEPVIPPETGLVIAVLGLDGVGKPIAEAALRPERYAALLGVDAQHAVTPEDAAFVLTHPDGQRKGVLPGVRFQIALNKADTPALRALAGRIAAAVPEGAAEGIVTTSREEACL